MLEVLKLVVVISEAGREIRPGQFVDLRCHVDVPLMADCSSESPAHQTASSSDANKHYSLHMRGLVPRLTEQRFARQYRELRIWATMPLGLQLFLSELSRILAT